MLSHSLVFNLIISIELETELAEVVGAFCERGFPFTGKRLKQLAYEVAVANKRKGFSPTKRIAGRYWLKGFLRRFPELRKKNAKNLSIHRAKCANPVVLGKFFAQLKEWVKQWGLEYKPFNIWNCDESGVNDVPQEQQVIGLTGVPASQTVCGEKGVNTTILTYASAGGLVMPPMVIFKAGKVDKNWREAAPSGYAIRCSKTGYINQALFAESGEIFVRFLKEKGFLDNNQKCLLLLDSHKSHLFNIHFMNYLKCNNVEVVCFPPHCTHLLQPLDDTPYGAFKSCYQQELADWNNRHLGVKMSKTDFFRVLIPAYTRALTPQIVQKGFANTGIYPINPQASKLQRIGPSIVSDKYSKCQFRKSWLKLVSSWFVRSEISKRDFFRTGSKRDFRKMLQYSFPL